MAVVEVIHYEYAPPPVMKYVLSLTPDEARAVRDLLGHSDRTQAPLDRTYAALRSAVGP